MIRRRCALPAAASSRPPLLGGRSRGGMTLLEVLIATAILAVSFAALGRRGFVAIHAAESARKQLEGTLIARHVLDAIQSGSLAPATSQTVWRDATEWHWWTTRRPGPESGLTTLQVFVRHESDRPDEPTISLSQLIRDSLLTHAPAETASAIDNRYHSTSFGQ